MFNKVHLQLLSTRRSLLFNDVHYLNAITVSNFTMNLQTFKFKLQITIFFILQVISSQFVAYNLR